MEQLSWRCRAFWNFPGFRIACCLAGLALLASGCGGTREAAQRQANYSHVVTPQPPAFLTGPGAMLLTNWSGFSARVEVGNSVSLENNSSGQLLGNGSKLMYAPQAGENTDTRSQPGGYLFIWDVAQSRGYVLSEALQAYAPVAADLHVTSFEIVSSTAPLQRYSGHSCEAATVVAQTPDGTNAFDFLRATDLHGFPLRIQAHTASPMVLSFSNVRFEPVASSVFMPPDGFTLYPSPQAMADELAARQNNFRRKSSGRGAPLPELERRY